MKKMPERSPPNHQTHSPPWNTTTKAIVAVSALALFTLLIWVFRNLIQQVVLAALLAYLLHPLISFIDRRTPLNRVTVVLLVYLSIALTVLATFSLVGVTTFQQALELSRRLPGWFEDAVALLQNMREQAPDTLMIGPLPVPLASMLPQLPGMGGGVGPAIRLHPADFQPRRQPGRQRRHRHGRRPRPDCSDLYCLHIHCQRYAPFWRHDRQPCPEAPAIAATLNA